MAGELDCSRQGELFTTDGLWFHIFRDLIQSGKLAELPGSALKVYLVIKSYADLKTGLSFPGIDLISEKSGLSVAQIHRELTTLIATGLLLRQKSGRKNIYKIREHLEIKNGAGEPRIEASWDYVPVKIQQTLIDVREAITIGTLNINNLNVTFNVVASNKQKLAESMASLPMNLQKTMSNCMQAAGISYTQLTHDTNHQ